MVLLVPLKSSLGRVPKLENLTLYASASTVKWIAPGPCLDSNEVIQNYTLILNFVNKQFIDIQKSY